MNTEMKMEKRKLSELRPADYNPRKLLTPEDKESLLLTMHGFAAVNACLE